MHSKRPHLVIVAMLIIIFSSNSVFAGQDLKTLAILPFENNSITEPEKYDALSKGLAAMLITDLTNSGGTVKIIEREKIAALLKEIALGQSGSVDQSTAIEVGKVLGAQTIAFGSFMVLGSQVRIDMRIVKVETSETILGDSVSGDSDEFIELEKELAMKISKSLQFAYTPAAGDSNSGIDAALLFSQGLDALDRGDKTTARKLFRECVEKDATYQTQVDNVKGING